MGPKKGQAADRSRNMHLMPSYMRLLDTHPDGAKVVTNAKSGEGLSIGAGSGDAGVQARVLSGHTGSISEVSVIKDSKGGKIAFASSSLDGTVRLWDTQTGEALATLKHNHAMQCRACGNRSPN